MIRVFRCISLLSDDAHTRVLVNTTGQPKAIAYPTDSRLYLKALQTLVRQAKRHGFQLRRSHTRVAKSAALMAGRYAHAKQLKRMSRQVKKLKTFLGRVFREICRKIAGNTASKTLFARLLCLVERLLAQRPKDKNKLYALHAREVACIAKGKARTPTSSAPRSGLRRPIAKALSWRLRALRATPGHTLSDTVAQAVQMTGVEPERIYVDRGYRGHNYDGEASVMISGTKRGLTPQMKRELKRRSAIEATIGHMKADGRLDRNFLKGQAGDVINALLAAPDHNMCLILNALALWLAWIMTMTLRADKMANSNTSTNVFALRISMA